MNFHEGWILGLKGGGQDGGGKGHRGCNEENQEWKKFKDIVGFHWHLDC